MPTPHPDRLDSRAGPYDRGAVADGRFRFTNLAPGDYYVVTTVTWMVPSEDGDLQEVGGPVGPRGDGRVGANDQRRPEGFQMVRQFALRLEARAAGLGTAVNLQHHG